MAANVKKVSKVEGFLKFFKGIRGELKKVIWPSRKQLINNTLTVFIFCLLVGVVLWLANWGLSEIAGQLFLK